MQWNSVQALKKKKKKKKEIVAYATMWMNLEGIMFH